jgi:hypothetical protein
MIKNYVLFLVLILFNLNIKAQAEASLPNLTQEFTSDLRTHNSTLHGAAGWTAYSGQNWRINGQKVENGTNYDRLNVKRQGMYHQWNTPINAAKGDILTLKIYFKFNGSTFTTGATNNNGDVFSFGLKSVLDSSTAMAHSTSTNGEVLVLNIADADTNGEKHLNVRYKTNDATAAYCTSNCDWATLTIKYFIGNNMNNSRIFAQLDNNGTKSGWLEHTWDAQELYDAITDTSGSTAAYTYFYSGKSLTETNSTNQIWIDKYEFWTDADTNGDTDTGLVMIDADTTSNGASSTGEAPGDAGDRVFIFDRTDVYFSGDYNRTWGYLWINDGAKMEYKPTAVKSLTLTGLDVEGTFEATTELDDLSVTDLNLKSGGTFTVGTVDALNLTNFDVENLATAIVSSATSLTTTDLDVDGSLTITTTGDISATDLDMSGTLDIGGTNDLTLDNLNISSGGSLTVTSLENGSIKNLVLNGTIDFEESGFKEGLVKVSSNSSFNNASATSSFDSNMTLTDSGTSANNLTVAPGGFLLRHNSRIIHWDSGSKWKIYDGSSWTQPAAADDGSLTGLDRTSDYSNVNLFYNASSYSTNQIDNILEGTDPNTEPARDLFTFNDIRIFDEKVMVLNGCRVAAQNIYVEDSSDPNSIVSYAGNLKVENSYSGNIEYNRNASETDQWYLISGPVAGASIDDFVTNEDLQAGTGNNIAFATFENDDSSYGGTQADAANGWWSYYQNGSSSFGDFVPGKGYAVKRNDSSTDATFTYTGTMNDGNVNIAINKVTTGLNLVGNPYLAAININEKANATNNLLELNTSILEEETAWFWNGNTNSSGAYTAVNQLSDAKYAAPMSGFFVRSKDAGGSFSFTNAIQTTSVGGAFNRANVYPKINLSISDGNAVQNTQIFYVEDATTGWDNGYDSTTFESSGFQIFTKHADNSTNQNLAIQSLPQDNYDNMIIPVGVNASAGTEITIAAEFENLPAGINVYLEDALDNRFTLLDENNDFNEILNSDENGTGRFYLHTMSNSLGENEFNHSDLIIYASSRNSLRIIGLENQNANVEMFDMMGKRVLKTSFSGAGVNNIILPNLNKGVYIVKVVSEMGITNKKLIIQ